MILLHHVIWWHSKYHRKKCVLGPAFMKNTSKGKRSVQSFLALFPITTLTFDLKRQGALICAIVYLKGLKDTQFSVFPHGNTSIVHLHLQKIDMHKHDVVHLCMDPQACKHTTLHGLYTWKITNIQAMEWNLVLCALPAAGRCRPNSYCTA